MLCFDKESTTVTYIPEDQLPSQKDELWQQVHVKGVARENQGLQAE